MEKIVSEIDTESIYFPQFALVEPHELLSFHPSYTDGHVPFLKRYLTENLNRTDTHLTLKRVQPSGLLLGKTVSGVVKGVFDNYVQFYTNQDVENEYDEYRDITIRFDNVLGIIPLIPQLPNSPEIDLVTISNSNEFFSYTQVLEKMTDLLSRAAVAETHTATIYFRYKKEDEVRFHGNYKVDCKILEVNKSNVLIQHHKTSAYVSPEEFIVESAPYNKYIRYIAPQYYMRGVTIEFGYDRDTNFYAD